MLIILCKYCLYIQFIKQQIKILFVFIFFYIKFYQQKLQKRFSANQPLMKKQKSSTKQIPIQLSANKKSHSINLKHQQPLFVPYKIQWKNSSNTQSLLYGGSSSIQSHHQTKQPFKSLQNCANNNMLNNNGSKAFYQNMKNQLLTIKQDVQKMILKQKKQKNLLQISQSNVTRTDQQNTSTHTSQNGNNGCIKTISIKNKCQQQKMNRVESLYENVEKALSGKANNDSYQGNSSKFIVGQSKYQQIAMKNNFIEDQLHNKLNLEQKYKSQNDYGYARGKSKSISTVFWKEEQTKQKVVGCHPLSNKIIHNKQAQQNDEQINVKRQKLQLDINLPSFDRLKKNQEKLDREKQNLIHELRVQLNILQKQLSSKDEQLLQCKKSFNQLSQQMRKVEQNIKKQREDHENMLTQIKTKSQQLNSQRKNEISNLQISLSNKQNNIKNLQRTSQNQKAQIQQLNSKIISLIEQLKVVKSTLAANIEQQSSQSTNECQRQQNLQKQNQKLKQKYKIKQNQVYIYQQELKQAKHKIKELKQQAKKNSYIKQKQIQQLKAHYDQQKIQDSLNNQNNSTEKHHCSSKQSRQDRNKRVEQLLCHNNQLKAQNDQLNFELQKINKFLNQKQVRINKLTSQNSSLKSKILAVQQQSKNAIQQMINNPALKNIGEQLSRKFSMMVDQNYSLKNKISHLQANIEEITLKNMSLSEQIKIYEQKQRNEKSYGRRLKIQDWDKLAQQRDNFKYQYQNVKQRLEQTKQFYEVQIMKKQNNVYELKQQISMILESQNYQIQVQNHHSVKDFYNPALKFIKKIQNIDSLLVEFKNLIDQNIQMKKELKLLQNSK